MLLLATLDLYAPKTIQGFGLKKGKDFCFLEGSDSDDLETLFVSKDSEMKCFVL